MSKQKLTTISLAILALWSGSLYFVFATPPTSPYLVTDNITDPTCLPGAANCYVDTGWSLSGNAGTNAGMNFIGTTDAVDFVIKANGNEVGRFYNSAGLKPNSVALAGGTASSSDMFVVGNTAGSGATFVAASNFIGNRAGQNATLSNASNFFGISAGQNASSAFGSNFLGNEAGRGAVGANNSNFFGTEAGKNATNAGVSNFFGPFAGSGTHASFSNFFGYYAGHTATDAIYSNFFGYLTGANAPGASNSIFIGTSAGENDTVDNTGSATDSSILIGDHASTGGFSNSIAIGAQATNTASDQFVVGSSYTKWQIAGVDYTWPISQAASSGYVLTNNGSGILTWSPVSGGGSLPLQTGHAGEYLTTDGTNASWTTVAGGGITSIGTINAQPRSVNGATVSGSSIFLQTGDGINPGLLVGETTSTNTKLGVSSGLGITSSTGNVFVGLNAGENAANVTDEVYVGRWAGWNATNSNSNNVIGRGAGIGMDHIIAANFFGNQAGQNSTYSGTANFFGNGTGDSADNAIFSTFIGNQAGASSNGAAHSIFIGTSAGLGDNLTNYLSADSYVAPISYVDTSILIGHRTSTGNFKNSIAIGAYATNTSENQFMVGSAIRPIDATRINGSAGTQCTITTGTGIACTSDERLKTNILDLHTNTLEKLLNIKTVTYNWLQNPNSPMQVGFLAQNLEQYFPELVATDSTGYKSVYYAQMTPILVEAIRELNMKVDLLSPGGQSATVFDGIKAWLGDAQNGITEIIAGTLRARDQICIDDVCMTKEQLRVILQNNTTSISTPPADPVTITVVDVPEPDTTNPSEPIDVPPVTPQN
jgi:hypothetical protein